MRIEDVERCSERHSEQAAIRANFDVTILMDAGEKKMKSRSRLFVFVLLVSSVAVFSWNCTSGARPSEETISDASSGGDKTVVDGGSVDKTPSDDKPPRDDKKSDEPSPMKGRLFINEVAASGEPNDWFELYNSSDKDIDLSDYTVADDLKDDTKRVKFPKGTIIKAGAYLRFEAKGASDLPFKLGGDEELGLWDKEGRLVDSADWNEGDAPAGKSWGRFPNGTGDFKTLDKPTPAAANTDNGGSSCVPVGCQEECTCAPVGCQEEQPRSSERRAGRTSWARGQA